MNTIDFAGYKWRIGHKWGSSHPSSPHEWYDPECVNIATLASGDDVGLPWLPKEHQVLRLQTMRNLDSTKMHMFGTGRVESLEEFSYGTFEADVLLPKGNGLFPAFWLFGVETWPPEIDIFEGFSGKSGFYTDNLLPYKALTTNIHCGTQAKQRSLGMKSHMLWKKFDDRPVNFTLEWFPDQIAIYYDDKCVRRITDRNTLNWFAGIKMRVVFNNSIYLPEYYTNDSVMQVYTFNYMPFIPTT